MTTKPTIYTPPKGRRVIYIGEKPKVHIADVIAALKEHFGGKHDK